VRRQDVQLALVTDKIKHCLDFRLAGAGFQANFKTQVAILGAIDSLLGLSAALPATPRVIPDNPP
jgi:hypothetical protein